VTGRSFKKRTLSLTSPHSRSVRPYGSSGPETFFFAHLVTPTNYADCHRVRNRGSQLNSGARLSRHFDLMILFCRGWSFQRSNQSLTLPLKASVRYGNAKSKIACGRERIQRLT